MCYHAWLIELIDSNWQEKAELRENSIETIIKTVVPFHIAGWEDLLTNVTDLINEQKLIINDQKTIVNDAGQENANILAEIGKRHYY